MLSRWSSVLALALGSLALAGCSAADEGGASNASGAQSPLVGAQAPEISAETVTGEGPKTLKDASGKVVIVDFWATYCDPCKKSFPKYQALVDQFGGELAVIGVSVDDPDDAKKEQLEQFVKSTGVKFSIVWDKDKSAAKRYSPPKMPSSYIIDKQGVVRHLHAGYTDGEENKIATEIKELLGK